jgi:hypothetical protein
LIADTVETCDALNRRLHDDLSDRRRERGRDTTTVSGARGHQVGVGDVVVSRRNDAAVLVFDPTDRTRRISDRPVRNGQRWQVLKVDDTPEHPRIAARRLGDGAIAVFDGDYLTGHVQWGHAVTVHSAQGVTAERVHAVLADTATRNLGYVAMTRGRDANHVYLYERTVGEADHHHRDTSDEDGVHLARRGSPAQAARMLRQVIGRDERARTAHQVAAETPAEALSPLLADLVTQHQAAVTSRHVGYQRTQRAQRDQAIDRHLGLHRARGIGQSQQRDQGYDLSL